jgi:hypothetical protein
MLHAFDASAFVGVVLDESSILKSLRRPHAQRLVDAFSRRRIASRAPRRRRRTTSPSSATTASSSASNTRPRCSPSTSFTTAARRRTGASRATRSRAFWRWVATWGAVVKTPSDLGYDDGAFALPPLRCTSTLCDRQPRPSREPGCCLRWRRGRCRSNARRKRGTIDRASREGCRADAASKRDQFVVWCELNDEPTRSLTSGRSSVPASDSTRRRGQTRAARAMAVGAIASWSASRDLWIRLNWQHCHRVIFIGASHSYERTYQAIRRCWRFGQTLSPSPSTSCAPRLEAAIVENYRRKEADAARWPRR